MYGNNNGNATVAQPGLRRSLPRSARSQYALVQRGPVHKERSEPGAAPSDVYVEEQILDRIREDPKISSRNLARETGVSKTTVLTPLHEHKLYPHNFATVRGLEPNHYCC